ncbi:protein of unknown function [Candidatus Nitrospira inopinata]|uniref:Uncharacterized protein n=1 Tax=Candidatus Nitrospira inopinata TaxID=1715989 RepID=A0A0S4KPC6_9BACT|nr:protein of unknown function [Candidatus Nitrospira inopinata]
MIGIRIPPDEPVRTYFMARVLGLKLTGERPVCVRSGRDPRSARARVLDQRYVGRHRKDRA